jgi:hypothetical protein
MAEDKKEKKSNPLFELINAIFSSREYVYNITPETANQSLFMVLRRLAIKYPVEANVFNDSKVNAIDVIRFWSDYLYCGYPPKWIYTSVTSKKTKSKDEITKEDIKLYKSHFNITDKQYDDAMRFYPKELIDEVKELRDYFKKLKGGSNEE